MKRAPHSGWRTGPHQEWRVPPKEWHAGSLCSGGGPQPKRQTHKSPGDSVGRWKWGFEWNWGWLLEDVSFEDEAVDGQGTGLEGRVPSFLKCERGTSPTLPWDCSRGPALRPLQ